MFFGKYSLRGNHRLVVAVIVVGVLTVLTAYASRLAALAVCVLGLLLLIAYPRRLNELGRRRPPAD